MNMKTILILSASMLAHGCGAPLGEETRELGELEQPVSYARQGFGRERFDVKGEGCGNQIITGETCYVPSYADAPPFSCVHGPQACRLVSWDDAAGVPANGFDWPAQNNAMSQWFRDVYGTRYVFSFGTPVGGGLHDVRVIRDDSISGVLPNSNIAFSQVARVTCTNAGSLTSMWFPTGEPTAATFRECRKLEIRFDTGSWMAWVNSWTSAGWMKERASRQVLGHFFGWAAGLGTFGTVDQHLMSQTLFKNPVNSELDEHQQCIMAAWRQFDHDNILAFEIDDPCWDVGEGQQ